MKQKLIITSVPHLQIFGSSFEVLLFCKYLSLSSYSTGLFPSFDPQFIDHFVSSILFFYSKLLFLFGLFSFLYIDIQDNILLFLFFSSHSFIIYYYICFSILFLYSTPLYLFDSSHSFIIYYYFYLLPFYYLIPTNTIYLYNICTTSVQRFRRWSSIVLMSYKCISDLLPI